MLHLYKGQVMKTMDIKIISESLKSCVDGKASFPEHVKKVSGAGVLKYLVDLACGTVNYYGNNSEDFQAKLPNIFLKKDAVFSKTAIVEAIALIQQGKIHYLEFLEKISLAGITTYEVDIAGKNVTYVDSNGDKHIEPFPSETPKP
jgi:uncharacterized protein YbcV (DUF1398 family)